MFTLKARFTKPISKIYGYYFATLCSSLYKTLGWETMLFIQNSFEISCEFMKCRDVGVGMEKWTSGNVYEKCTVS